MHLIPHISSPRSPNSKLRKDCLISVSISNSTSKFSKLPKLKTLEIIRFTSRDFRQLGVLPPWCLSVKAMGHTANFVPNSSPQMQCMCRFRNDDAQVFSQVPKNEVNERSRKSRTSEAPKSKLNSIKCHVEKTGEESRLTLLVLQVDQTYTSGSQDRAIQTHP
eukprot:SAG11_NODE_940_length_6465_cov_16.053566_1_plen_163_part_00